MTIDWALLAPALLLLLFPAATMLSARAELCSFDCLFGLRDRSRSRPWWWLAALGLDPIRGYVGAWLLVHALEFRPASWATTPKPAFAVLVTVLAAATLCQTFTRREHGVLLAPVGFVSGAIVALIPGFTPYSILALAFISLFGFRQFYAFFTAGLFALPAVGFLFETKTSLLGAALPLFLLPLLAGMLSNSALELPWHYKQER